MSEPIFDFFDLVVAFKEGIEHGEVNASPYGDSREFLRLTNVIHDCVNRNVPLEEQISYEDCKHLTLKAYEDYYDV